jgi:hypothetical protein
VTGTVTAHLAIDGTRRGPRRPSPCRHRTPRGGSRPHAIAGGLALSEGDILSSSSAAAYGRTARRVSRERR